MSRLGGSPRSISDAHLRLGDALRRVRLAAGISTRRVPKVHDSSEYFSSGHISLVESGVTTPSRELVEAYANFSSDKATLTTLYLQMIDASREAGRARRLGHESSKAQEVAPTSVAQVRERNDVQRHYIAVSNRAEYTFGADGVISDVLLTMALRARSPGVRLLYGGHSYPSDPRSGVVEIQPVTNLAVADIRESASGTIAAYFLLGREISPDDSNAYVVQYRVIIHSDVRSAPRLRYFAGEGNQQLSIKAEFPEPVKPTRTWWFAQPNVIDAEQANDKPDISTSSGGIYEGTFDHLIPGWCYGFAWTWPDPKSPGD